MIKPPQNETQELIDQYLRYTSLLLKIKVLLMDVARVKDEINRIEGGGQCQN
ncbi:MAG: hypothetical protein L6Q53_03230 [Candidatus Brocadia sinica]|uniref:ABC-type multidrug transport system ATPase component n=1 Tax=Candidatus Brocadia sinica JPN1 TaxID=1197129 RepID=A0ABQ0K1S6_9BACT|nr:MULTISPECIES: hypothetical protein [Brocadia]MCK6467195.1 hypothetical protein [Candidatus Brocadia sinica]NOG42792.1 hypothetical protein [Planctomycetota bacterium]GAN35015.1 ABC-type multidrug transport system ATPase component [Candidatus Brocadia sinica JPN1]GIK12028.1 MAG: hypothetical protein BroJett002_07350 [Candidatus Brocadia sinica]GJQ19491.1 MAG: hypothetical protein HBSIN01_34500 [Candidatus Brocadia sinica]